MDIFGVNSPQYLPASREPSCTEPAEVSAGIYQPPCRDSDTVRLSDASIERARFLSGLRYESPEETDGTMGEPLTERDGRFSTRAADIVNGLRMYRSFSGAGIETASLVNKYI